MKSDKIKMQQQMITPNIMQGQMQQQMQQQMQTQRMPNVMPQQGMTPPASQATPQVAMTPQLQQIQVQMNPQQYQQMQAQMNAQMMSQQMGDMNQAMQNSNAQVQQYPQYPQQNIPQKQVQIQPPMGYPQQPPPTDEEPEMERTDAMNEAFAKMTDDQKKRFELLRSNDNNLPHSKVKELMKACAPEGTSIADEAAKLAAYAGKLFIAELVETARFIQGNESPITPESIMLAFNKLQDDGKIPGYSEGIRRGFLK